MSTFDVTERLTDIKLHKFIDTINPELRSKEKIGDKKALCALSGGVDSSVAAALINKAIGKNLTCIFVDHGLLRKNEAEEVEEVLKDGSKRAREKAKDTMSKVEKAIGIDYFNI
mgnify:CR=1 FL=1